MFPGQGSQKVGMGAPLFARFPAQVAAADAELGYSIEELCCADPLGRLNDTQFTQPALFVVNALMFLDRLLARGELPHLVAGHSLGEYNALFAAGVFDFATGVRLVKKRAELMARARGGAMAAVLGLGRETIADILARSGLGGVDVANYNSPRQTVISGPDTELDRAQPLMEAAGAKLFKKLAVSAAFHSRYMQPAAAEFKTCLRDFTFAVPRIPVIANATAQPYGAGQVAELLAAQIDHPVRWVESIRRISQQPEVQFEEIGPGNVLAGLIRRIQTEAD
ncbi:MAG TPA: ACP S-malonyltransferase [Candidatus Limnocylindria bacterium]|jgi:trans-AT polyketide synthase/acyltransferase/oxidoreductase domain-containing protein|nr:ACP S-malonyltransferase [Candidatus Limnocylindria bacterium]